MLAQVTPGFGRKVGIVASCVLRRVVEGQLEELSRLSCHAPESLAEVADRSSWSWTALTESGPWAESGGPEHADRLAARGGVIGLVQVGCDVGQVAHRPQGAERQPPHVLLIVVVRLDDVGDAPADSAACSGGTARRSAARTRSVSSPSPRRGRACPTCRSTCLPSQTIEPGAAERLLGVIHLKRDLSLGAEDLEHRARRLGHARLEPADPLDSDGAPRGGVIRMFLPANWTSNGMRGARAVQDQRGPGRAEIGPTRSAGPRRSRTSVSPTRSTLA